jgi:mannose-6-phosphate isomerase
MPALYPLRFAPVFRRYLWGGRRLGAVLGKAIGPENDYAESWEIVDRGEDQSRVLAGPLAGKTLAELVLQYGDELFGRHGAQTRFPLLFKLLDANRDLSVQVHPNDEQAARLSPPDLGKTEAWVVLATDPGSVIYAGLRAGVQREDLASRVSQGKCHLCLHRFEPRAGDVVFLPAGTVHALGAGLLIAEIQQSSDTTFRLFDWNRRGPDGKPRPLHVEQALESINFDMGPVRTQQPVSTEHEHVEQLVACDKFVLNRWRIEESQSIGGDDRFHLICVIEGQLSVPTDPLDKPLKKGETMLLPASAGPVELVPSSPAVMLEMYLP